MRITAQPLRALAAPTFIDGDDDLMFTARQTSAPLRIAIIGYSFMGSVHAQAWTTAPRFFDLGTEVTLAVVCGRDEAAAAAFAQRFAVERIETDWRTVIASDDIDVVDICTPGHLHAEIAVAALAAGKHVLCEKPLANSVDEAERMTEAAELAELRGVRCMVSFSYRRTPALAYARQLVEEGRLGDIRHIRALYLQDWIVDPGFPLVWRLDATQAGSGALGDLGAHIIDLAGLCHRTPHHRSQRSHRDVRQRTTTSGEYARAECRGLRWEHGSGHR